MQMERNELHSVYKRLIKERAITHVGVAAQTGIHVDSLRQFKKNQSLHHDKLAVLDGWLRDRGFTQRETSSDVLREVRSKLAGCIDVLDNPVHSRSKKARILLNQLKILVGEYGSEIEKIGLQEDEI